jgi:hypothetical protein
MEAAVGFGGAGARDGKWTQYAPNVVIGGHKRDCVLAAICIDSAVLEDPVQLRK